MPWGSPTPDPDADRLPHRRGADERPIGRQEFLALFSDFLDTRLYGRANSVENTHRAPEIEYRSNRAFWADALSHHHYDGQRILLRDFTLLEWIPQSPGRFFTENATLHRLEAKRMFFNPEHMEYLPAGKLQMVLGGIGSLRLASRPQGKKMVHILGLSSNGVSHEGIPVLVDEDLFLRRKLKDEGAVVVDAIGTLRSMPQKEWRTWRTDGVPTVYLSVEDVTYKRRVEDGLATVSVMFSAADWMQRAPRAPLTPSFEKLWSYASFDPLEGPAALEHSVKWLEDYALRHSQESGPPEIFSDFDEAIAHFREPVEFTLADASMARLDMRRLMAYSEHYHLHLDIQELRMGDTFTNVSNSTIINRSTVVNSLNAGRQDEDVKAAILKVVDAINKSGNKQAAERFEGFVEEAAKQQPRKSMLASLWSGTVTALPSIAQIAGAAEKICSLFQ